MLLEDRVTINQTNTCSPKYLPQAPASSRGWDFILMPDDPGLVYMAFVYLQNTMRP